MGDANNQLIIKCLTEQWHLTEQQYRHLLRLEPEAASELVKIDTTLHQLFAGCPQLADLWMTSHNMALGNDSPMELIEREGMAGLRRVVQFLCLEQ